LSFDRLAPCYDLLGGVAFGGQLHRSQVALLDHVPPVDRALVVGGGTGRFLAELVARGKARTAVSIDTSPAMCARTAARVPAAEVRVESVDGLRDGETFDLVATHCFLDLFDDSTAAALVARLDGALRPGGTWMFSDFADDAWWRRVVVQGLYVFFRATCGIEARRLPGFAPLFAGYETVAAGRFAGGLLQSVVYRKPL
jgi:SAM-dependent methyltransferase